MIVQLVDFARSQIKLDDIRLGQTVDEVLQILQVFHTAKSKENSMHCVDVLLTVLCMRFGWIESVFKFSMIFI